MVRLSWFGFVMEVRDFNEVRNFLLFFEIFKEIWCFIVFLYIFIVKWCLFDRINLVVISCKKIFCDVNMFLEFLVFNIKDMFVVILYDGFLGFWERKL